MQGLCVGTFCGKVTCFLSLSQVWGSCPPFLWGIGWKPICGWEIAEEWMPEASRQHSAPNPAEVPVPLLHTFCWVADLHTKNSSGRVCTCIASQYSAQTEQGFERPSAQGELQSGCLCRVLAELTAIQQTGWLPAGVTRAGRSGAPVSSGWRACGLLQSNCPGLSSSWWGWLCFPLRFLFFLNYVHDYHARCIALKPKVNCLISN